ncbi:hypothetical protein K505DRAFT_156496 [Melanomma pulvis-pyrius CBS 109.77]|uniref:Zn(2)-C6 fungal-type domain-containing protein n=1 Tax=Melanomma pulvis-pyrius CBS 109.77 TaxID=1314802 RepID=A0A6A6XK21_9PLEO|nr:hypothetical protein K505DRAFT_156496 [Melanomma pulvis-pyrius CBS 109.77]
MSSERPAKRIRQACEPCRRKKSRCPGEKPICSHCSRLRQACHYAEEAERGVFKSVSPSSRSRRVSTRPNQHFDDARAVRAVATPGIYTTPRPRSPGTSASGHDGRVEDRLRLVEAQLAEVLRNQGSSSRSTPYRVANSPVQHLLQRPQPISPSISEPGLPPLEVITHAAEVYLQYCDCQPLPLFHRATFMQTMRDRDPEIIFSLLALTLRFLEPPHVQHGQLSPISGYVEAARSLVSRKIFDGAIELSTIQALCLLTLVDFSEGNTRRASIYSSQGMSLAHNAGLTCEFHVTLPAQEKEERRRCFWSLFLLKRLHGADFMVLDFSADDNFPWYPETTSSPHAQPVDGSLIAQADSDHSIDKGIMAYAIQQTEVWFKITRYAWRRGKPSSVPPWSSKSEYSTTIAQLMDLETRMPYKYRFNPAKFSQQPIEHLNAHRDYWGPWLFVQFLYHSNLCLLNHPLLMSLRLRNFKCVIPEIFLQHTSDLISSHASWIINFIDMLDAKGFRVSDPFLGHCVAVVATIYLQESFVDDPTRRKEKQGCFHKCVEFIRGIGAQWPHVSRIADKLQRLGETVSSTHVASEVPTRQNRKLLIDLGQFFEILEYSSSSEISGSAKQLFGPTLHLGVGGSRREIAQTTVLPEPTRVEGQEFGSGLSARHVFLKENRNGYFNIEDMSVATDVAALQYSDDELAVLAESFFHQRPEIEGSVNWWNGGDLVDA